jgi:hypothetical protein
MNVLVVLFIEHSFFLTHPLQTNTEPKWTGR